jgi:hypothetical protein
MRGRDRAGHGVRPLQLEISRRQAAEMTERNLETGLAHLCR